MPGFEPIHPVRLPKLLAIVRTMRCARCGAPPPSEAMHYSGYLSHALGRGRSVKATDAAVAPGCRACHHYFDDYQSGNNAERAAEFLLCIVMTYHRLLQAGKLECKL